MGLRIIETDLGVETCMYCSTEGWAFGPVATAPRLHVFQEWLRDKYEVEDARTYPDWQLRSLWKEFCAALGPDDDC